MQNPEEGSFGYLTELGGYNAFVKLNARIINAGYTPLVMTAPPLTQLTNQLRNMTLAASTVNGIVVTWQRYAAAVAGDRVAYQVTSALNSKGRWSVGAKWKRMQFIDALLLTVTITPLVKDAWYWVRIRYQSADGQITSWLRGQCQSG
jgi:hypothetical protein